MDRRSFLKLSGISAASMLITAATGGCNNSSQESTRHAEKHPLTSGLITLVDWAESTDKFGQRQSRYPVWNELLLKQFSEERLNNAIKNAQIQGVELMNSQKLWYGGLTATQTFKSLYDADPEITMALGLQYHLLNHGLSMRETINQTLSEFGYESDPLIIPVQDTVHDIHVDKNQIELTLDMDKVADQLAQNHSEVYNLSIQSKLRFAYVETSLIRDAQAKAYQQLFTFHTRKGGLISYNGLTTSKPDCFESLHIVETNKPGILEYYYIDGEYNKVLLSEKDYITFIGTCEEAGMHPEPLDEPVIEVTGGHHYSWADMAYADSQSLADWFPGSQFIAAGGNQSGETLVYARQRMPSAANIVYIGSGNRVNPNKFNALNNISGLDYYIPDNEFTGDHQAASGSSVATAKCTALWGMLRYMGYPNEHVREMISNCSDKIHASYDDPLIRRNAIGVDLLVMNEKKLKNAVDYLARNGGPY